jgi:hypothetical protein
VDDARALATLLAVYWPLKDTLPGPLRRALWTHEYAARTHDFNIRLVLVVTALEALVHTQRFQSTAQFRCVARLATELGVSLSVAQSDEAYDLRSHVAHGDRLGSRLPHPPSHPPAVTADEARLRAEARAAEERRMTTLLLTMEEILRKAIRLGIMDPTFRAVFEDPARIRARWPI